MNTANPTQEVNSSLLISKVDKLCDTLQAISDDVLNQVNIINTSLTGLKTRVNALIINNDD